jgi:resuscitation-promoting factor RpfA
MSEHDRNGTAGDPRDADLSRLYRESAREAPPAHLDAAILAAARREVGARPQRRGAFAASRWRLPVALAAAVVLSVSVVTMVMEEGSDDFSAPAPPRAAAPALGGPHEAAAPVPAPAQEPREARTSGKLAEEEARPRALDAPGGARQRMLDRAEPGRSQVEAGPRTDQKRASESAAELAPRSLPAAPAAAERDAASKPLAKRAPAAPEPADAGAVATMRREAYADEAKVTARVPPLSPGVAGEVKALDAESPTKWLERIAALRRDGRGTEADELLAEFRRRFPDHPLPGKK